MGGHTQLTAQERQTHDENVGSVLDQGKDAVRRARLLHNNHVKISAHVNKIAEATLGAPKKNAPKTEPHMHETLDQMQRLGRDIFRTPVRRMSKAEINMHHRHLSALLPLLKENAEHAAALSQYWTRMHEQLDAVRGLFSDKPRG